MCTRYSLVTAREKVESQFGVILPAQFMLSYNIAPTHHAYVITNENIHKLQYITWGLIPHWSNDGKNKGKLINARKENISGTASFRMPIRQRRCIVLADSYYVWKKENGSLIPYRVVLKNGDLMAIAGIWDVWYANNYAVKSFSIITTPANAGVEKLSDRMPFLLANRDIWTNWLCDIDLDRCQEILTEPIISDFDIYMISPKINSVEYKGKDVHDEEIDLPTEFYKH